MVVLPRGGVITQTSGVVSIYTMLAALSRASSSLAGHTIFSRAEVGGVMGRGKNTYGDYSQVSASQWNVRNVSGA